MRRAEYPPHQGRRSNDHDRHKPVVARLQMLERDPFGLAPRAVGDHKDSRS